MSSMRQSIHVLFLQDNGINESLALAELAGVLAREGHRISLLLEREEEDFDGAIVAAAPDLVIVPCNVYASRWVRRTANRVGRLLPDVPLLVGGTHPTFAPTLIEAPEFSLQLVGEAEVAVSMLCRRLADGGAIDDIPGIWVKRDGKVIDNGVGPRLEDLGTLPLPARDLYFRYPFMRDFPWKKFTTGRGCENRCAFCYNEFVRSLYRDRGFVRRKPVAAVIEEIRAVAAQSTLRWVHFADDLFVTDRAWLEEFANHYPGAVGLPFSCNSSADRMNEWVAETLARAGCRSVAMGVETADENHRVRLLHKPSTNRVLERAAAAVKGAGMELVTFLMVALPGEDLPAALASLRYGLALGADARRVLVAVPLPGTEMTRLAARDGYLAPHQAEDFDAALDVNENPFGPYYDVPEPAAFENLVNLAPLLSPLPDRLALALVRRLPRALTRPMRIWMSFQEKRLFRFSLAEGARFFLHVGNPMNRTTNYVTLI